MAEDLVGRMLGRYRITALVGRGGMATVYKAQHPGLEQTVAVKVLHPHIATDPDLLRRFRQEAQAVANLRHPNIVRVVDFDYIGDAYFMVMEYIDGPTLAAYLAGLARQGRRLAAGDIVRMYEALGSAVDYAHSQGMIHRDIKPSNILLTSRGEPVLTDYGIAKIVGVTQHTATGTVMGSAYYMSPEQAQGANVDGRSDLYSLGVILFEVLTGRVPYDGDTLATVLVKHITSPVPTVRAFNAALPPALDDVIQVALAKDPANRFPTGQALAEALRQGLMPAGSSRGVSGPTTVERPAGVAPHSDYTRIETPVDTGAAMESPKARTITSDVYISYAPRDKDTADAVCAALEARELSCWMAPRDVLPGQSFAQALGRAIHAARAFVLVFSSATNESQQVERELDLALSAGLPIVPLRIEAVQPRESIEYYLAGQHWLDALTPPLASHLDRLARAVRLLLEQTAPSGEAPSASRAGTATPVPQAASAPAAAATTLEPGPPPGETTSPQPSRAPEPTVLEPHPAGVQPRAAEIEAESLASASGRVPPPFAAPAEESAAPQAAEATGPVDHASPGPVDHASPGTGTGEPAGVVLEPTAPLRHEDAAAGPGDLEVEAPAGETVPPEIEVGQAGALGVVGEAAAAVSESAGEAAGGTTAAEAVVAPPALPGAEPEAPAAPSLGATTVEPAAAHAESGLEPATQAAAEPAEGAVGEEREADHLFDGAAAAPFAVPSALAAFAAAQQPEALGAEVEPTSATAEARLGAGLTPPVAAPPVESSAPGAVRRDVARAPARPGAEGRPDAAFRKRALTLAATVGVAWIAVLVLIDMFVR